MHCTALHCPALPCTALHAGPALTALDAHTTFYILSPLPRPWHAWPSGKGASFGLGGWQPSAAAAPLRTSNFPCCPPLVPGRGQRGTQRSVEGTQWKNGPHFGEPTNGDEWQTRIHRLAIQKGWGADVPFCCLPRYSAHGCAGEVMSRRTNPPGGGCGPVPRLLPLPSFLVRERSSSGQEPCEKLEGREREREREEACCLVAALRDQFRYLPLSTGALSPPWCVWKNQAQLGNSSSLPLLANSSCPSVAQGTCHSVCWVPEGAAPSPLATARPDLIRATWSGWRRQVARLGAGHLSLMP